MKETVEVREASSVHVDVAQGMQVVKVVEHLYAQFCCLFRCG